MSQRKKLFDALMAGNKNIRYNELCELLEYLGFVDRQRGTSHRIYARDDICEDINIQRLHGGGCKAYQLDEVRKLFEKEGIHV